MTVKSRLTQTQMEFPEPLDPTLVQAARHIYRTYLAVHADEHGRLEQPPLGVVIDRFTYRGVLVFNERPALLPPECFVPLKVLESDPF